MRRLLLLSAIALVACQEATPAEKACAVLQEKIDRYLGKKFRGPVPVRVVEPEFIGQFARELEEKMLPRGLVDAAARLAERMHVIPRGYDVRKGQVEMVQAMVAGLYDPQKDCFYLVKGRADPGSDQFTQTAAHELIHAYRDIDKRYFEKTLAAVATDADRAIAISCLTEGDATFLGQGLGSSVGDPTPLLKLIASRADVIAATLGDSVPPSLKKFPFGLREMALGRYGAGLVFACKIYAAGGLAALDKAFDNPPRSTEQVLHPEKYIGPHVDEPTIFRGGDPTAALGAGWSLTMANTMGEFEMRVQFSELMGRKVARKAASGWDGARFHFCEKQGAPGFVGLVTTWDSDDDAKEFAAAWLSWAGLRDGKKRAVRGDSVVTNEGLVVVRRMGSDVLVADGVPEDRVDAVLAALGLAQRE